MENVLQSHLLPHHRIAHINTRYKLSRKEWIANINNSYKVAKKGLYNYGHVVKWEEAVQENSPSEECTQWLALACTLRRDGHIQGTFDYLLRT